MIEVGGSVDQLLHLRLGCSNHPGITVAGVYYGYAGKTVDILAALDIGYDRTFRLFNYDRRNRPDKTRYEVILILFAGIRNKFLSKNEIVVARWNVKMFYVRKPF